MKIFTNIKETSVRVPRKNFKDFGGTPLYMHTISKFTDFDFYIDTDSDEIIDACKDISHVTAYKRLPEHDSMDNPGILMTKRFLDEHVEDPTEPIAVVHVTCPFIKTQTILEAFRLWESGLYDSICSVNVIRNFCLRKSYHDGREVKYIPLNFDFRHIPSTQDLEPIYELNHAFFMFNRDTIDKYDNRIGSNPYFMETRFPENIDIDYPEDFELALKVL